MLKKTIKRFAKHRSSYYKDRLFRRVKEARLEAALESVGVTTGATLYLQTSFGSLGYYPNGMPRFIALLQRMVGPTGTVVMPCFPFGGSMEEYAASRPVYDARTSPSKIGKLPEVLRLTPGARRSCHPTHPVAALGGQADWIVDGHEHCDTPQGDGSPFDKLVQCGALIVRINTPAYPICHRLQEIVDWPHLFIDGTTVFDCIDDRGRSLQVETKIYRKRVPFVMFHPGAQPGTPVACNIIDFPVIYESRERRYEGDPDRQAAREHLLEYRRRLEADGSRRRTVFNDCPIDTFPADRTMDLAVAETRPLIERFRVAYDLDQLTAGLASGDISI